ncbi:MAG: transglycosylase SLT domain-containing protein [Sandaracinaceae bacterium]
MGRAPLRRLPGLPGLTLVALPAALAAASAFLVAPAVGQTPVIAPTDHTLEALNLALRRRMTVRARETGPSIYVAHCRNARGGCLRRVATFSHIISGAARRQRIDPFLLAAVAVRESGLDPTATGAAGERGLIQLHPRGAAGRSVRFVRSETFRQGCARSDDACQQEVIEAGAHLLSRSIERCGGVPEGLGAYNRGVCGPTDYSRRVLRERQRLLRLAKGDARTVRELEAR